MKQLEIDAMALAGTRARLQAAEERILSLALVSNRDQLCLSNQLCCSCGYLCALS